MQVDRPNALTLDGVLHVRYGGTNTLNAIMAGRGELILRGMTDNDSLGDLTILEIKMLAIAISSDILPSRTASMGRLRPPMMRSLLCGDAIFDGRSREVIAVCRVLVRIDDPLRCDSPRALSAGASHRRSPRRETRRMQPLSPQGWIWAAVLTPWFFLAAKDVLKVAAPQCPSMPTPNMTMPCQCIRSKRPSRWPTCSGSPSMRPTNELTSKTCSSQSLIGCLAKRMSTFR